MPKQSSWNNSDGLVVRFGTRTADDNVAAVTGTEGLSKQISVTVDTAGFQGAASGNPAAALLLTEAFLQCPVIPVGSVIRHVTIRNESALTGATNAQAAVYQSPAGASPGNFVANIGAAVGNATSGTTVGNATQYSVVTTGGVVIGLNCTTAVLTGGKVSIKVEYVPPLV